MELFQLEAFLAVVREGSFSAAAKALFRTQPAISQTIKKLEDEIGRPLFDRSSRRGVLTDAGRVLADHAERLVNLRQRAMAALDDVRQLQDRPPDDGGERADVFIPVADSARVSPALSGSAHYGAARPRQPRAGAGARLRRRLRRDHLPSRHRVAQLDRRLSRRARVRGAAVASAGAASEGLDQRAGARVVRRASRVVAVSTEGDRDVQEEARRAAACRSRCRRSMRSRNSWRWGMAWRCCRRSPSSARWRTRS